MFFWTNEEMEAMSDEEFATRMACFPEPIPSVEQMMNEEFMNDYRNRSNEKVATLIALNKSLEVTR